METLRIEIVNPKAKKIIEELAELKLINIQDKKESVRAFDKLLKKLRSREKDLSLDEITKEVELVRVKRYGKKS